MADKPTTEKKIKSKAAKASDSAAGDGAATTQPISKPVTQTKHAARPPGAAKKGKLLPKHKHRLPRREKKAQQKAAIHL